MVTVASRMPLIEGVGDEVLVFVGIVVLLVCIMLAWFSTSVSDQPLLRATAVLVIERRRSSQRVTDVGENGAAQNATASDSCRGQKSNSALPMATPSGDKTNADSAPSTSATNVPSDDGPVLAEGTSCSADGQLSIDNKESQEALSEGDAKPRLRRHIQVSEGDWDSSATGSSNTSGYKADETQEGSRLPHRNFVEQVTEVSEDVTDATTIASAIINEATVAEDGTIRVRLKFLNDTQRLVEGKLEEPLGEFKRRYFGEELENDKMVRLIFNGQLLRSDQETLQFYGLFDNCVLHCQISNNVSPPTVAQAEPYAELDLSRFMLPLFGVILGVVWYCRVQYRQFFNATSTFALLGITGLFLVSIVALFIPRREVRQANWRNEESQRRR